MKRSAKGFLTAIIYFAFAQPAAACPWCRAQVKSGVYNENFTANLFVLLLPVIMLTALGIALYFKDEIAVKFKWKIK